MKRQVSKEEKIIRAINLTFIALNRDVLIMRALIKDLRKNTKNRIAAHKAHVTMAKQKSAKKPPLTNLSR